MQTYLNAIPTQINASYAAGSSNVIILSNSSWSFEENESWLSASSDNNNGNGSILVQYDANQYANLRIGTIIVRCAGADDVSVVVIQAAAPPSLLVSPTSREVSYIAGATSFDISSNVSWSVNENSSWITVQPMSGSFDSVLEVSYEDNPATTERTGQIIVSSGTLSQTVIISQEAAPAYLTASPLINSVTYLAGELSIDVNSNIEWSVVESEPWLVVQPMSGTFNGTINILYEENPNITVRTGQVMINGSNQLQTIYIEQEGHPETIANIQIWFDIPYVRLSWTGPSNVFYHVYKSQDPLGVFTEIGAVIDPNFTDIDLTDLDKCFYRITYEYMP